MGKVSILRGVRYFSMIIMIVTRSVTVESERKEWVFGMGVKSNSLFSSNLLSFVMSMLVMNMMVVLICSQYPSDSTFSSFVIRKINMQLLF